MSRRAFLAASLALGCGCALLSRRVRLRYEPSRNVEQRPRQTELRILPFLDKRPDRSGFGRVALAGGLGSQPLEPSGDPAAWVTKAVSAELAAAGYPASPQASWRVGGALREASCGEGARPICRVRVEAWVTMKDNWEVLRQEYSGEGNLPVLFNEDPYESSLEEALREALTALRRDLTRRIP